MYPRFNYLIFQYYKKLIGVGTQIYNEVVSFCVKTNNSQNILVACDTAMKEKQQWHKVIWLD